MLDVKVNRLAPLARAALFAAALAATGMASAGPLSANVTVRVKLATSSGFCGAIAAAPGVEVSCVRPAAPAQPAILAPLTGGPLLPDPGAVPYQRVGTIAMGPIAEDLLPVYSDGTKITSWRVVTLDNARYVELTIAW
jgi:hypothetical protein